MFDVRLDARALEAALSERLEAGAKAREEGGPLDAFLLAAGLSQIVEDYFHREAFVRQRAVRVQQRSTYALLGPLASTAAAGATIASQARALDPRRRVVARTAGSLRLLVEDLAFAAVGDPDGTLERASRSWSELRPLLGRFPECLRETVLRLPDPFYRFDQTLDDCRVLAGMVADRWPDRDRPLLVVGVRTSGTYLAPLYAALFRGEGYGEVQVVTVRPHQRWRRREDAQVRAAVGRGALVLVVDDPPSRGHAVARIAADLEQRGADRESIVLVLPLFGPESSLPEPLHRYEAIVLPWRDWSIQQRLDPRSVEGALKAMLVGRDLARFAGGRMRVADVGSVRRTDPKASSDVAEGRRHVSARYRALFVSEDGETVVEHVDVSGLGPGYFSSRARDLAAALAGSVTEPLGIEGGLLYMREPPPETRIQLPASPTVLEDMVSYVVRRREALAVERDPSIRVLDDDMVWRVVADALGKALLGAARALAYPITHAVSRRLVAVSTPSVIDGNLTLSQWSVLPGTSRERLLKSGWLGRLTCYDAAFDLAAAAAAVEVEELALAADGAGERSAAERLLQAFCDQTQEEIDAERWLLYQLVELSTRMAYLNRALVAAGASGDGHDRASMEHWLVTRRALARAHQRYIHGVFFSDLEPADTGPLCALDVDWVLETIWLDFPAIAPAGALALRALLHHGFRPVLATARSLDEVRERCRAYSLTGGVAEFGSVVYDHVRDVVLPQVSPEDQAGLERLREVLTGMSGVYLDPAHRYSVRAVRYRVDAGCRGLDEETIQTALAAASARDVIRVFRGGGQTDFVHTSVDKGTGLRALAAALGADENGAPLAFAVGDDWPDLPMLDLAQAAFAPANLSEALRDGLRQRPHVSVTRYPYGSGVLQAVASLLGHDPRRCETCEPPQLSERQRLLVTALGGMDGPRRRRIGRTLALAATLARPAGARRRPSPSRGDTHHESAAATSPDSRSALRRVSPPDPDPPAVGKGE